MLSAVILIVVILLVPVVLALFDRGEPDNTIRHDDPPDTNGLALPCET